MDNILEVRGLKMHFGGVKAVDELSFDVHRHELLGVIGPNGSGKTTMFNALTGVYKPTDGKVTFNGIDITGKPLDSMVNYGIARTFQNLRVFKAMTVLDNIMIGNSKNIHTNLFDAALHTPRYRKYEKESLEKARELLSLLGLSRWENEYVGSIPYGIQKRIEFARAVIPLERRYCIHVKRDVYFDYWNVFGRAFEWTIDFWDACRCYNSSHRQIQSKRSCAYFITPLFDGLCNHRGFSANKNVGQ